MTAWLHHVYPTMPGQLVRLADAIPVLLTSFSKWEPSPGMIRRGDLALVLSLSPGRGVSSPIVEIFTATGVRGLISASFLEVLEV